MLLQHLPHASHGAVGELHCVAVQEPVQLVACREAGVQQVQELPSHIGGDVEGVRWVEPGDPPVPAPPPWSVV